MKVVINACWGGFGLSETAKVMLSRRGMSKEDIEELRAPSIDLRMNPLLVEVVEELGPRASGPHAELKVIEVPLPADACFVDDYDGLECVREKHRVWS